MAEFVSERSSVRMEISAKLLAPDLLNLIYTVTNQARQPAYLFNQIFVEINNMGEFLVDPNRVYVEFADGRAAISKKVFPVPADIDVESPAVPCLTEVAPGGKFSEALLLDLPLKPWTPYRNRPIEPDAPTETVLASFELGFFLAVSKDKSGIREVKTPSGKTLYTTPFPSASQMLLNVTPLPVRLPILVPKKK